MIFQGAGRLGWLKIIYRDARREVAEGGDGTELACSLAFSVS
jgi:hypothetical protein